MVRARGPAPACLRILPAKAEGCIRRVVRLGCVENQRNETGSQSENSSRKDIREKVDTHGHPCHQDHRRPEKDRWSD